MNRRALIFLAAFAIAGSSAAQPPSPANDRLVFIDLFAVDARGRTVRDLTSADLELREDGAPRSIEALRFVPASAAGADARLFAIFLDEYHVSAGASADRVREALTRFVDRDLTDRDLLVVMKPLDSIFAIRLSADRDAARRSILSFEGRKGVYEPRNSYERNYIAGSPARIEAARTQVAWSAINALAIHMGGLAVGRKTLVVVSEGIPSSERRRGQESLPTRDTVIRSANRANVSIYPVDPRSTLEAEADTLKPLATETDGETIAVDLDAGLRKASAETTGYYLVSYRSASPDDGKFHEVEVSAKRSTLSIRARKGFTAAPPDDALRAAVLARLTNPRPPPPVEPIHVSPLIHPWFGISRAPTGLLRVTFVWEPAPRVPGDLSARRVPTKVIATATASDGRVLFEGPVVATGPAAMDEPGAARARAVFDAPPGRLRVRMSIQDAAARVLDVDVRDISIRELKGDVAIGTPEVLRARNAREFHTLDTDNAVPVAAREFSRTERLLIRFPAYGPTGTVPAVTARLLSRNGQAMRDLAVAPSTSTGGENAIDLPLAGLAAGDYIVEVSAAAATGDVRDRVGFRVTP